MFNDVLEMTNEDLAIVVGGEDFGSAVSAFLGFGEEETGSAVAAGSRQVQYEMERQVLNPLKALAMNTNASFVNIDAQ
jgi:hypothetical protein